MAQYNYSRASALVAVTNSILRGGVAEALKSIDFGTVETASGADSVIDIMGKTEFDLIVIAGELGCERAAPLIQEIRRGRLGNHPFPLIITLVAARDYDSVRSVIDGGPDDVLLLPAAPKQILTRVDMLTRVKRRFVVASGYVGPDRRASDRLGSGMMADAPNPLMAKAVDMPGTLWLKKVAEARQPIDRLVRATIRSSATQTEPPVKTSTAAAF